MAMALSTKMLPAVLSIIAGMDLHATKAILAGMLGDGRAKCWSRSG
jgi:hypothetical protein